MCYARRRSPETTEGKEVTEPLQNTRINMFAILHGLCGMGFIYLALMTYITPMDETKTEGMTVKLVDTNMYGVI